MKTCLTAMALLLAAVAGSAAPTAYAIDPTHTFPSFEADHMGISVWRGKFNKSSGKVLYDKTSGTGTVEIVTELASVDFGMDALATWARGKDFFDVKKYPRAVFKGSLQSPVNGVPTQLVGEADDARRDAPADADCQLAEVHPAPDAQARLLRGRRQRQLQSRRLRPGRGQGVRLQNERRPAHPGRSHCTAMTQGQRHFVPYRRQPASSRPARQDPGPELPLATSVDVQRRPM